MLWPITQEKNVLNVDRVERNVLAMQLKRKIDVYKRQGTAVVSGGRHFPSGDCLYPCLLYTSKPLQKLLLKKSEKITYLQKKKILLMENPFV